GLHPPVLLAGGGKASHRQPMEDLAAELGVQDQVRFLGLCRDVPALLLKHQIAVLSTHYEGMPLALIEGMAAGCAVVGSAVPGVREVIRDGEDGRLVPPNDPAALADALHGLLTSTDEVARLGAAARAAALQRHSRELMSRRYEDLCCELVANAGGARPDAA
ncbi:MAG: glycosyltransferase, partial [Lysobacter sp.]